MQQQLVLLPGRRPCAPCACGSGAAAGRPGVPPRHARRQLRRPCPRLRVARPQHPDSPGDGSPGNSSSSSSSSGASPVAAGDGAPPGQDSSAAPRAGARESATVAQARQELREAWALLKDAAGTTFVPGYQQQARAGGTQPSGSISSGAPQVTFTTYGSLVHEVRRQQPQQQQQQLVSLPDRLRRLLSGEFIQERNAGVQPGTRGTQQQQEQPQDAKTAAMRFELLRGYTQQQQQQQQQQREQEQEQGQQQQQQQEEEQQQQAAALPEGSIGAQAAARWRAQSAASDSSFYPATTQLLVFATWGVFLLQWWQALPEVWAAVQAGSWWQPAAALLLVMPDTPATHALCLDMSALQQGRDWWRLFSSGLCNSGLAATWLCCVALRNCGALLEAGSGQLQVLTVFLLCAGFASLGHVVGGRCVVGATGPGAVVGMYMCWTLLAAQHMADVAPMRTVYLQGGLLLALMLCLGLAQPAVGVGSIVGGALGGAVAVRAGAALTDALGWCLAVPLLCGTLLLRFAFGALKVAWLGCVFVAAAVYQVAGDAVKAVKGL